MSEKSQKHSLKKCKICDVEKLMDDFHVKKSNPDGRDNRCKSCCSEYKRNHRMENLDRYKKRRKEAYEKTKDSNDFKEKRYLYSRDYYNKNRESILRKVKDWRGRNREERNAVHRKWLNNKRSTDLVYKMNTAIGNSMREALKYRKSGRSWTRFVDYDIDELIAHIETNFSKNMSWSNYGIDGWHIDHKVPVSSFNFDDPNQIKICWSLSNLFPRWATTKIAIANGESEDYIGNLEKGNKLLD